MKHKNYDVIMAAAEGKDIQYRANAFNQWEDYSAAFAFQKLSWEFGEYRIKPEPEYPKTRMEYEDLKENYYVFGSTTGVLSSWHSDAARNLANAAIRRAIQDGDVVLPGEKE